MPRAPRIEYAGATFHVTARGNRGERIFADRQDSLKFLSIFEDICADHSWDSFAWALLPDRYQLTVRINETNLAKGMQRLNGRYSAWVNRKRGRSGHLLAERYRAVLVDRKNWLLPLVRLAALEPVRAGLAGRPEQWLWGSYRYLAQVGAGDVAPHFARDEVLGLAGPDPAAARLTIQAFVARGLGEDREDLVALQALMEHNQVLGSPDFARQLEARIGANLRLASTEPRTLAAFRQDFKPSARAMAAAYWIGGYRQKDIAAAFDMDISTVSRAGATYREEFSGAL